TTRTRPIRHQIRFLLAGFFSYTRVFFFSSRRRHTRFSRDWSSDVCSSDLPSAGGPGQRPCRRPDCLVTAGGSPGGGRRSAPAVRSEERRVGKEGRYRGGAEEEKKKEGMEEE